jgi:hypothetical protein
MQKESDKCKHCENPLPSGHEGPCPKCGKTGKIIYAHIEERFTITDSIGYTSIREYYEKHSWAIAIVIAITIFSALIGLFLSGIPGVLIGLALGAISYIIGPKAMLKIREITHG